MAQFTGCVDTDRTVDDVYAYLVDFTNAEEWDPGTESATKVDDGHFLLQAGFFGTTIDIHYRVTESDPPHRFVLELDGDGIGGRDVISMSQADGRTRVRYEAEIEMKGARKLLSPAVSAGFPSVARKALAGLADALDGDIVACD